MLQKFVQRLRTSSPRSLRRWFREKRTYPKRLRLGHQLPQLRGKRIESESSTDPIECDKDQYSINMEIKDQYELKAPAEMKTPYRNRYKASIVISIKTMGMRLMSVSILEGLGGFSSARIDEVVFASRGKELSKEG